MMSSHSKMNDGAKKGDFFGTPLKNSGRNAIQYVVSRIRYQYSENLVANEKVYVNLIPFIVMYTFLIHL